MALIAKGMKNMWFVTWDRPEYREWAKDAQDVIKGLMRQK